MRARSRAGCGILSLRPPTELPAVRPVGGPRSAPPLRRLKIKFLPSPHHRGRGGAAVDMIVIHYITCPPGCRDPADVAALFLGTLDTTKHRAYREVEGRELSAHFLVDRAGRITQFVPTDRAAFHAGASRWRGRAGCNDFSVGIELIPEVVPVTRRELAVRVEDVLDRRLHLTTETRDHGMAAASAVARLMGRELGWDEERVRAEEERFRMSRERGAGPLPEG